MRKLEANRIKKNYIVIDNLINGINAILGTVEECLTKLEDSAEIFI
jgi:hypothetical protein